MAKNRHKKRYVQASFLPQYLVSVIIPVHRRMDLLTRCVEALPKAFGNVSYEVIIEDNNTPKEEKEIYSEWRKMPNMKIYEYASNDGFSISCNRGAKQATSPLLFFLNSDVIMDEKSGEHLVMAMDDLTIGAAGMKLIFPDDSKLPHVVPLQHGEVAALNRQIRPPGKLQHIGLATSVRGEFVHLFIGWNPNHPKVLAMRDVYAITGAALMTRRKLYTKIGGFYEGYGKGTYEDVDYCMSLRDMGYNIIVENKAVGTHYTGATAEAYQIAFPLGQNRMLFMQRWGAKLEYTEWKYL